MPPYNIIFPVRMVFVRLLLISVLDELPCVDGSPLMNFMALMD